MNRVTYHIKFTLNGKEYKIEDYIDNFEWRKEISKGYYGLMHEHIFKVLHKKFAEMIAMELMKSCPDFLNTTTNNQQ